MFFVGILLVSFTPGLFWLWFYLRKDSHQPAPRKLIALTFGLGCLATIPAAIIEYVVLGESFLEERAGVAAVAPGMLLVVGPVEEISKFLAVRLKAYRSLYFDEPIDGLVYAAAASLGFASLENLFYVLEFGPEVMLVRAPISTLAHLVFGLHLGLRTRTPPSLRRQTDAPRYWCSRARGIHARRVQHLGVSSSADSPRPVVGDRWRALGVWPV